MKTAAEAIADHARNFSLETKELVNGAVGVPCHDVVQHGSVEFSLFSDNFAVSVPVGQAETLFKILAWASNELLQAGFLVRGGIALGYLHHDHDVVFGPALVEAVKLEGDAIYPRVLCSASLTEFLADQTYRDSVVIHDEDRLIVNIAAGSTLALADLSKVVERELATHEKCSDKWKKWSYIQGILPKMYWAK